MTTGRALICEQAALQSSVMLELYVSWKRHVPSTHMHQKNYRKAKTVIRTSTANLFDRGCGNDGTLAVSIAPFCSVFQIKKYRKLRMNTPPPKQTSKLGRGKRHSYHPGGERKRRWVLSDKRMSNEANIPANGLSPLSVTSHVIDAKVKRDGGPDRSVAFLTCRLTIHDKHAHTHSLTHTRTQTDRQPPSG